LEVDVGVELRESFSRESERERLWLSFRGEVSRSLPRAFAIGTFRLLLFLIRVVFRPTITFIYII
jgi:hypothetical protein